MRGNPRLHLARAALAALLAAAGGCHTVLGPAPLEENWQMHPGPRVTFFVRPASFAEQNVARLSEVIEDQDSSTVRALGLCTMATSGRTPTTPAPTPTSGPTTPGARIRRPSRSVSSPFRRPTGICSTWSRTRRTT